jgi:predicted dehydrogenase
MSKKTIFTRRSFLRTAAAAAGSAVAMPYLIPSGLLAARGRPGPNDRIGVAGIGVGRQGSGVVASAAKQARLVGVADVNLPRAKEFAAKYKVESYLDYRKLLERKDVDAIITATPEHWRALICIHACQAGKDIYAEKPMTLTIREGRLMAQAARKYQRVFQTGSMQRSMPANRAGCEMVRNGRIGKISKVIAFNYPSPWECALTAQPVPAGLDWDLWCGPNPLVPYHLDLYTPRADPGWISFRPYSGGEMTGWGAHGFDQIQWALGMDESGPIEVWTEGPKFDPPTYKEPEPRERGDRLCGTPKVFFRYAGDIVVELTNKGPHGGGIFIGEKGTITIDRGVCKCDRPEIANEIKDAKRFDSVGHHLTNWLDCIKTREKPVCDVEIGHR